MTDLSEPVVGDETFSAALRRRTRRAHEHAEGAGFMQSLLDGQLPLAAYIDLLGQLALVYEPLEAAAEAMRNDPVAGRFVSDDLTRGAAYAADLDHLAGTDRAPVDVLPATRRYVARLQEVCFTWPAGFVAHHYTRFLGDLSGGQMMRVALQRVFVLDGDRGVASLTFDRVRDRTAFKDAYRAQLDAAPWNSEAREQVIDEILTAYRLNTDLLADLGRRHLAADPASPN